jgi:hypothetical protein
MSIGVDITMLLYAFYRLCLFATSIRSARAPLHNAQCLITEMLCETSLCGSQKTKASELFAPICLYFLHTVSKRLFASTPQNND